MANKKVFVSGCYDMLHSGHVAFFKEAARYGDLYVGIGADKTVKELKGRETINSEEERKYMVNAIKYVKEARVNRGSGLLDFVEDIKEIKPDIFVVNEDGSSPEKQKICKEFGIEYVVLKRIPDAGLPARSTTSIRSLCTIPYRIDLAGGWLDQPYVSKFAPGWVLTISIEPTIEFNERSGMATSTRKNAIDLWNHKLPLDKPEKLAEILFAVENKPGKKEISGSQDALGITMPNLNRYLYADEDFWPKEIQSIDDEDILTWLEDRIYMKTLWPRKDGYDVFKGHEINEEKAKNLAKASEKCWKAITSKNIDEFGQALRESFEAQIAMFPAMTNDEINSVIDDVKDKVKGYKVSGAGGGGYLILISDKPIDGAFKIKIRRSAGKIF